MQLSLIPDEKDLDKGIDTSTVEIWKTYSGDSKQFKITLAKLPSTFTIDQKVLDEYLQRNMRVGIDTSGNVICYIDNVWLEDNNKDNTKNLIAEVSYYGKKTVLNKEEVYEFSYQLSTYETLNVKMKSLLNDGKVTDIVGFVFSFR